VPKPIPAWARSKRVKEITTLLDPKEAKKRERRLNAHFMELDEKAEKREDYTAEILSANDESIDEIVAAMVKSLESMTNPPSMNGFTFEGTPYNLDEKEKKLRESIQLRNRRWIAVRCLVACAELDIKIGNFKLPTNSCIRCGAPVKKAKKKSKKSRAVKKRG
jgi:hypothetical protein